MMNPFLSRAQVFLAVVFVGIGPGRATGEVKPIGEAPASADLRPGLLVYLGCEHGAAAAALRRDGKYRVQALVFDKAALGRVRRGIRAAGAYGPVSAELLADGPLPYADDLVNVVVIDRPEAVRRRGVALSEAYRAVAPYGSILIAGAKAEDVSAALADLPGEKPAVRQVGGWVRVDKPYPEAMDEWDQYSHDPQNSYVSNDRVVGPLESIRWIAGETAFTGRYVSPTVISAGGRVFFRSADRGYQRMVECRDAFNGLLLWKTGPKEGVRTLAADAERLYVLKSRLEAWDASTGKQRFVFQSERPVWAVLLLDRPSGVVVLGCARKGWLKAFEAATGKELWHTGDLSATSGHRNALIGGSTVYYLSRGSGKGENGSDPSSYVVRGVDLKSGEARAEYGGIFAKDDANPSLGQHLAGKLILTASPKGGGRKERTIYVVPTNKGGVRWSSRMKNSHFVKGGGGFLHVGGRFWLVEQGKALQGLAPDTGETVALMVPKYRHVSCGPLVATARFIIGGRNHLIDVKDGSVYRYTVTRTPCRDSSRMANGLVYYPRHTCPCTDGMNGNIAISPARQLPERIEPPDAPGRLEKGPAYEQVEPAASGGDDWPTYRANALRGGAARGPATAEAKVRWSTRVGVDVSAPVIAGGRVFVGLPREHRLVCLDAADGKVLWTYDVGGRVDSPPTIHAGLALFGCRDGWVYALRAADGELAWRFLAAPADRRIVVQEQVESLWPVYGSVLVEGGLVYVSAGRHVDIDGGIWVYALKPATGKVAWSRNVRNKDHRVEHAISSRLRGEGGINDILRSDGKHAYVAGCFEKMALNLKTGEKVAKVTGLPILSTPNDLLLPASRRALPGAWGDPTNASVTWIYHPKPNRVGSFWANYNGPDRTKPRLDLAPKFGYAGDLIVFDGQRVFGVGREQDPKRAKVAVFGKRSAEADLWFADVAEPIGRLRGMVLAGDLAAVGFSVPGGEGKAPKGKVVFYRTASGQQAGRIDLPEPPRWDGMAVAGGRLHVSTEGGGVVCYGESVDGGSNPDRQSAP